MRLLTLKLKVGVGLGCRAARTLVEQLLGELQ